MEKNLFEQAKDLMAQLTNNQPEHDGHLHQEEDKQAVIQAIQAAYHDATPEEQQQLQQFEEEINKKMS